MDIAEIISAYGAYYINSGQNAKRLLKRAYRRGVTEQLFTSVVTDDTVWRLAKTVLGRILQPFQKGWTPTGQVVATPLSITQFPMKVDLEETPDSLEATWLGFLADKNLDRAEWPFVRWFVEEHILPQIEEDYELNEVYAGRFVAPTAGIAGPAGTAMDGIRIQINRAAQAGKITPIALGAIPSDPVAFCEYVEAFCDAIDKRYAGRMMHVNMNETLKRRYDRGRGKKYGLDTNQRDRQNISNIITAPEMLMATATPVEYTSQCVLGLPSMTGSDKIWCSPPENLIRLSKKSVNEKLVRVESVKRQVAIFTDFYKGVGFGLTEALFTNDRDMTIPV